MSIRTKSGDSYPRQLEHIQKQMQAFGEASPGTMGGFAALHKASTSEGALDAKTKELIALAISVSSRCDGCIAFHTHDALRAGASRAEIIDALSVAVMMAGGPALVYATHVLDAIPQFQEQN